MKIKQTVSLAGAVIVFLLSLATLAIVPTTVEAEDCSVWGTYIGQQCAATEGCQTQGCYSCAVDWCVYYGGADNECVNTCLGPANYECEC